MHNNTNPLDNTDLDPLNYPLELWKSISNELKDIHPSIKNLQNLLWLDLSGSPLNHFPLPITQLLNLIVLNLEKTQIKTIPPEIEKLNNLQQLFLSRNEIENIPPEIGQLKHLQVLHLYGNNLVSLPLEIQELRNLRELDLRANKLPIPPEILENINNPWLIINYYSEVLDSIQHIVEKKINYSVEDLEIAKKKYSEIIDIHSLKEAKILVIGQGSVGKTSLVRRIISNKFEIQEDKTKGISISHWNVDSQAEVESRQSKIRLNIWDFGGQEIMHATHQFFLTKRSLYLLVLDSRLTQEENRIEYWLKIIQSFSDESPVLIVGNKIDQHPLDIDRTGLQKKYPNIIGILETSAATGAGIEELKVAITEQVNNLPHVRDLLPETWFTVKTELEGLGQESNFITHDKYLDLCAENEVSDEMSQRTLIGFLHDLGVVLHFQDDPRLEALGILNPQWVTNGVYKILNAKSLFENKGVLPIAMLNDILNLPEYPRDKRLFIVDMMKKFELCYDLEPDKTFLVPDLLPKDEPDLDFTGVPAFEYLYPVLPSSVLTRFIVRMNQKIDDNQVWRSGVLLKIGDNRALVKADVEDRTVHIVIDGIEHTRRDALSAIRYQLDEIHASIKGLNPQKRVPVPGAHHAEPLEYDYLLLLEREGQETHLVKDGDQLVKVNVRQILSGVESEFQRRETGGNVTNIYVGGNVDGNMVVGAENEVRSRSGHEKSDNESDEG